MSLRCQLFVGKRSLQDFIPTEKPPTDGSALQHDGNLGPLSSLLKCVPAPAIPGGKDTQGEGVKSPECKLMASCKLPSSRSWEWGIELDLNPAQNPHESQWNWAWREAFK